MHYNLVKASNRRYLEELKNRGHEMKPLYDAVNIMQDTEWVINKRVYDVIVKLIETDNPLGKLPVNPQHIELPIKPVDIETNKESLVRWKREATRPRYMATEIGRRCSSSDYPNRGDRWTTRVSRPGALGSLMRTIQLR